MSCQRELYQPSAPQKLKNLPETLNLVEEAVQQTEMGTKMIQMRIRTLRVVSKARNRPVELVLETIQGPPSL